MNQKINIQTWQDDFRHGLKSISALNQFFELSLESSEYEIFIPYNLAEKIKLSGAQSVLWKQFIPTQEELSSLQETGLIDPIGDKVHSKPGALVHRYTNRVLFFPTTICPVICRYCFRKNELSNNDGIFDIDFEKTLSYLNDHKEIEEIIFSGGDPFIISNSKIKFYLEAFSKISHIKYIRFHTRAPVSLPLRVDQELCEILEDYTSKFETISVAIHINHCDEIDEQVTKALNSLKKIHGLNLLSQTVLLTGINDNTDHLVNLFKSLNLFNIKPYYLHHPDKVKGAMHFQVDIREGRKIYANLRSKLPGWLIPTYIIDTPGGLGKLPLFNPESFEFTGKLISSSYNLTSS